MSELTNRYRWPSKCSVCQPGTGGSCMVCGTAAPFVFVLSPAPAVYTIALAPPTTEGETG